MTTKRFTKVVGVFAILGVLAVSATAFAYGNGQGRGMNKGYAHNNRGNCAMNVQLTDEQQKKFDGIVEEFVKKTQPIREQLRAKHMELNAFTGNDNVKPETISKLVADITDLRKQLFEQRDAFADKVEKEIGIKMPQRGRGMGMGMNGNCGQGGKRGYHQQRGNCPFTS